jgi:hypothetical protein
MLMGNPRGAASAVVLAVSLVLGAVACGGSGGGPGEGSGDGAPPATSGSATPGSATAVPPAGDASPTTPVGGSIAHRTVYFSSSVRAPRQTHEVLRDRGEVARFAAAVAKNDAAVAAKISASAAATDFARYALVGWAESTGCSAATSAALLAAGDTLKLHVVQPKPAPECLTDFRVTVVFEVPKDRIPARPAFS